MKAEDELLNLVAAVVDGSAPDWAEVDSRGFSEDERRFIRNLRLVAGVSEVHRTHGSDVLGPAPPGDAPRAAQRWGNFELLERIGEGGFGEVYRARDTHLNRIDAIKLLKPELASEEQLVERILAEGRALAELSHPNIVTVYEAGVYDGRAGLRMEYVQGRTLEEQLATSGPLGANEAAVIGQDICRALAAVHGAGQVHRDVKARNVIRAKGGRVVLMDFGAGLPGAANGTQARLTGTPLYLAPEILSGQPATPQSDVYAVGVLLFHLVTRTYPLVGASIADLREAHRRGTRRNLHDLRPDVPDRFVHVVERALAREPRDRYPSAGAMLSALTDALGARPVDPSAHEVPPTQPPPPRPNVPVKALMLAAGLLLAIGAGVWNRVDRPPAPVHGGPVKLAVLPLRNLTGGPDWRVDAVTEDLITSLGTIEGMQVAGWTSVSAATSVPGRSVREIGEALNVTWMIEGSVRSSPPIADQAVVSVRLLHAGTGAAEWTGAFRRSAGELFTVSRDVVTGVTEQLGITAAVEASTRAVVRHSQNSEARDAYLQARFLMRNLTTGNLRRARDLLETAIRIDPSYALAHAALAKCFTDLEIEQVISAEEAQSRALPEVNRALELDANLAEAHVTLGDLKLYYEANWSAAGDAYRTAVQLAPSQITGRMQYSRFLAAQGRVEEAIEEARIAAEADPLSPAIGNLALMMYYARRYDEAIALYQRRAQGAANIAQVHFSLARAYSALGQFDAAIRELQRAMEIRGGPDQSPLDALELARTYAQAGRLEEAQRLLAPFERAGLPKSTIMQEYLGFVYAASGDQDRAFSLFNRAIDGRPRTLLWAQVDPRLDRVRDDPRYSTLIQRLGLAR